MIRLLASLILIIFSSFACSTENLGIAFIHGTNDHRFDAESEYWKPDFTDAVAAALPKPENKLVVRCNFTHYMWEEPASGCVASQLLQFVEAKKITQLIVYTHSNGGNVVRWILSNPTYDSRFMRLTKLIKQVNALAPSSGGTILADDAVDGSQFEAALSWLFGYQNNAVKQQRIADMAIYNDTVLLGTKGRPSLPVSFRAIIGTDVIASPFTASSYCNGYFLNAGLKVTKAYLDNCADGYLPCESQTQAGSIWFYDWEKTNDKENLSHNQSRHSCSGLDQILRNDLFMQGVSK